MATPREDLDRLRRLKRLRELEAQASGQPDQGVDFGQIDPLKDISVFGVTGEDVAGTANLAQNVATGIPARIVGGGAALADIAQGDAQTGLETVQRAEEAIQTPLSESGLNVANKIGEAITSLGDNPGFAGIVDQLKRAQQGITETFKLGGSFAIDPVSTIEHKLTGAELSPQAQIGEGVGAAVGIAAPQTALEISPFFKPGAAASGVVRLPILTKSVKTIVKAAKDTKGAAGDIGNVSKGLFTKQSATKREIAKLLSKGSTDIETAKFKLDRPLSEIPTQSKLEKALDIGGPRVIKDKLATETIKQGFDEGVIAGIKGSSKADMNKMLKMTHIMEAGKKNARVALQSRPTDVAGDSLLSRFKTVRDANKKAGTNLDGVAKGLRGQTVDHSQAVNTFLDDLNNIGVKVKDDFSLDFIGSNLEGTSSEALKAQSILKTTIRRLSATKVPDAFDVHRMKKFIDSQVTFGKTQAGLAGGAENILKGLRRNLDNLLDKKFPQYDKVNTAFAETRTAIDNLQSVAGKKLDLTGKNADKATGTLLRRLMSNAGSRVNLLDSVNELEKVAIKHGGKFDDDLLIQVLFADELDAVFKPVARTSFQGQIGQALPTSKADALAKAAQKAGEKIRGIDEKAAFKSIKDLLKEGKK